MELILEVIRWRRPELMFLYELNNVVNGMEMLVRQFEFLRAEISCIYLFILLSFCFYSVFNLSFLCRTTIRNHS